MGRAVNIERSESDDADWLITSSAAPSSLQEVVVGYEGFAERSATPVERREVPRGHVVVVFAWGGAISLTSGLERSSRTEASSFVVGLGTSPTLTRHEGFQEGIEIRLSPLGAHRLFDVSMHVLSDASVDLEQLWGRAASRLTDRLQEAPDWVARFDVIDREIHSRIRDERAPDPEVRAALRRISASHGATTIAAIERETGWSRRKLSERFREQVGVNPKALAKVVRFERACALLGHPGHRSLASVAVASGYFDQAHFNRDFKVLAGCTPSQYQSSALGSLPGVGIDGRSA